MSFVCLLSSFASIAQDRKLVLDGNVLYNQQKYSEAAEQYKKALQKTPASVPAAFNLGNALMQQKKYEEARKVMQEAAKATPDKGVKSGAAYNTGNAYSAEQKWSDAVGAYKEALRANPADADAKYNLSYALNKLKQEQQQKQQQQSGGGGNQPQPQSSGQQPQKPQPQPQDKPQTQQSSLSKQQAENLLNALEEEEKKLRDKQQKEQGVPTRQAKDW